MSIITCHARRDNSRSKCADNKQFWLYGEFTVNICLWIAVDRD